MPRDGQSVNCRGWDGLAWDGCDTAILASGESLTVEQCAAVRAWRDSDPSHRRVIAINTTFRRALWADVLYACDGAWWQGRDRTDMPTYLDEAKAKFAGELWTQDQAAAKLGVRYIASAHGGGLSREVGVVRQGINGGHQAIGLAYWSGARVVYLLGYDMHGGHWHGEHPGMLRRNTRFDLCLKSLAELAADVSVLPDFKVINCTRGTADKSLPKADWQEVFA